MIPVTFKITRIFCSDTYALNAFLGIGFFFVYVIRNFKNNYLKALLILYFFVCAFFNFQYVKIFSNSRDLWKYSYTKEATPDSTVAYAKMLQGDKFFTQAEVLIRRVHDWQPDNIDIYALAVDNVFKDPEKSTDYKIKRLKNFIPMRPITHFYLAILYANQKDINNLSVEILQVFSNVSAFLLDFGQNREKIIGIYLAICEKYQLENGPIQFTQFKTYFSNNDWNYELIEKYKREALTLDKFDF